MELITSSLGVSDIEKIIKANEIIVHNVDGLHSLFAKSVLFW